MVKDQLMRRGIRDPRVLDAFREVPRERFVRPEDRARAYDDEPLKIGHNQTISQPYIVALTCQALELTSTDSVLEIGTGSGYQAAILSKLCRRVVSIERIPELLESARDRLADLGVTGVELVLGDGTAGTPSGECFDGIAVSAASPDVPEPLLRQIAPGGRIVIPIGDRVMQELTLCRMSAGADLSRRKLCDCRFVPLIGQHGFGEPGEGRTDAP